VFPAAPLPLITNAARHVFAALRDTVAHLADVTAEGETPAPEWVLAAGQRIHQRLTELQQARATARQVADFAPRRWPQRSRVRRAGERTEAVHLLAATVLSLAHATSAGRTAPARQPRETALSPALGELSLAFAALAQAGHDSGGAPQAAAHAARAKALVAGVAQPGTPDSGLIARLVETCADDTLRFTRPAR
jgi:hypothetical protein